MHKQPNRTYRIRPEAAELIAAWAALKGQSQGLWLERTLNRLTPPTAAGPPEARVRQAHTNLTAAMTRTGDL